MELSQLRLDLNTFSWEENQHDVLNLSFEIEPCSFIANGNI